MADPISAAIAAFAFSAGASIATATVVGAVAANVIIAAGTQLAINALTPKAKVTATASQLQTKIGAVTPRAIIMGRTAVAGTLLTPTPLKSGKDDRFASNFYALSHAGPSGVVESIQWGDDVVTFDGNGNAIGKYNDNMWLFQKNGDWSQTAISYVGHAVLGSSTPSAWDNTKTGKGCLMVALVVRYAAQVLGGNMQTPLFVVDANAVALIDPRTGLAATTQAQRRNPAVWAYSWRLGWFQNSKRVIGMGQASSEIHTAAYAYAANVADANSWTIGGEATTADDRYAVETIILQTCASVPVERNGLQSVVTSAVRSSVGTISSDDLRADPKWRYNTQQSSRPTAIQTRFRSESNRWQMVEGAEVTDAGWLTADAGREKRVTVEYPYAAGGSAHVGHLAALEASNAREPLIFTLQCKQQARYDGFVGDAVTVSLPEIGLSSTKMIITSRVVNPDGTVDFDLLVETDAKYDFAAGKTSAAPSFTLQPGFDIHSVPQPGAAEWASVAAQITSGATSLPIVRVTGSAADYSFASGVVFKLRLNTGGSPWLVSEDAPPAATQHEFRGLTNATSYIVGVAYRGVTGVEGPVRELAAVTSGVMVSASTGAVEPGAVRVGTDIFPGSGSTPLPGTQLLNDQITIDGNGRLVNTGTGSAIVDNGRITIDANGRLTTTGTGTTIVDNFKIGLDANGRLTTTNTGSAIVDNGRITIDAFGRLTTTGTGSVVVDNSKITLGTLGFTGATDATRNLVSTGLLSARPTGIDGDIFFATDDNNGAGLVYTKIAGAWVADPKAKVLFDNLTTTVNNNEATNSSFRSSQTATNSATSTSLSTLSAKFTADQQSDYLSNGQFLRGTNGWIPSGGASVNPLTPDGGTGRNGVIVAFPSGGGTQYYETQIPWQTWATIDLAWVGIVTLWNGGATAGASIRVFLQGKVGAGSWNTIAVTSAITDIDAVVTPKTLRGTAAPGYDTLRLVFELNPPTSGIAHATILTQRVSNWAGEFPSLDAGPRAVLGTEARVATEESARASADSALAYRSTTLESVVRFAAPEALNKNPTFATWSGTLPEDWVDWSFGVANITKATGDLSPFAYRQSNPAGAVNYGLTATLNGRMTQGWHVLEAEVTLNSGALWGGSVHLNWGVSGITHSETIHFAADADITGSVVAAGTVGRRYRFSKLLNIAVVPNLCNIYLMTSWEGTSTTGNAKDLTWHKCLVRPATQGEIDAKVAKDVTIPATIARIAFEETTRSNADEALALRSTNLESTVNNGTTGVSATAARLTVEEGTRALADSALAGRSTTLEARSYVKGNQVRGSRPNLDSANPNNLFARFGWQNQGLWNVNYSNFVDGPFLSQSLTSQTNYNWYALNANAVPVSSGVAMSAQAMLGKFGTWTAGTIGIVIYWYSDPEGTTLVSGTPNGVVQNWEDGLVIQGQNANARWVRTPNQIAPTGAQSCRLGVYTANATGNGVYTEAGAWMLKLEYGSTCTTWTDEAMPLEIDARVRTEESARASADSALATRATTLEATVNNATTGVAATAARLTTEESTRASADSALASRSSTLEAIASTGAPGANLVPNSALTSLDGYEYASQGTGPFTRGLNLSNDWGSSQNPTGWMHVNRNGVGSETVIDERSPRFRVRPSQRYGFAARLAPHRATASVRLEWLDASGAYISNTALIVGGTEGGAGSGNPANFTTVGDYVTLPSNAAFARVIVRLAGKGEDNPYVFWQAMDCWLASSGQTALRPHQDGPPLDRTAELVTLTARVSTEESARASGDSANASLITTLTAGTPNLFPVPTPVTVLTPTQQGWLGSTMSNIHTQGGNGFAYYKARPSGGSAVTEYYYYDLADNFVLGSGDNWTLSALGYGGTGAGDDCLFMYIEIMNAARTSVLHQSPTVIIGSTSTRVKVSTNYSSTYLDPVKIRVVFARNWAASGSYQDFVFNMVKLERGTVATAYTNSAQIIGINAVSVEGRNRAYAISGTQTEVNGRKGGFVMDNDGVVTNFQITADDFRIYQSVGGSNIVPFRVFGGQTQINDALIRTLSVIPDGGGPSHRVQLRPNSLSGADGASFTFSPAYGGIPLIRPVVLQPPALAAGETYDISATSLSASGFTVRAKKFSAGTPTAQSSGAGSNVGGTPAWQAAKPTSADADGNSYTYSWTATLPRVSNEFMGSNQYYAEYEGEFDVYYDAGSGWVYAYSTYLSFANLYTGSSPSTVTGQAGASTAVLPAIGQHGGNEFGLHAVSGTITAFAGVAYTTTTQSSVTALPGNFTFDIYPPT